MGKTIAERLQIAPNTTIWLSQAAHLGRLTPVPDGVRQAETMATATVAIVFADETESVRETLIANKDQLTLPGVLWVAYPRANTNRVNADTLAPVLAEFGMRPEDQVEIDSSWSALRVRPVGNGEVPFTD